MARGRPKKIAEIAELAPESEQQADPVSVIMESLEGKQKSVDEILTDQKFDELKKDKKLKQIEKWENGDDEKKNTEKPIKIKAPKLESKREKMFQNKDEIFQMRDEIRDLHRHFSPKYKEVREISLTRMENMDVEELDDLRKRLKKAIMGYDLPDSSMAQTVYLNALCNVETYISPFIPTFKGVSYEYEHGLDDIPENDPEVCQVDTRPLISNINRTLDLLDYQYNPINGIIQNTENPFIRLALLTNNLGKMAQEKNRILNKQMNTMKQQNELIQKQTQIMENHQKIMNMNSDNRSVDDIFLEQMLNDKQLEDSPKAQPKPDNGPSIEESLAKIKEELNIGIEN